MPHRLARAPFEISALPATSGSAAASQHVTTSLGSRDFISLRALAEHGGWISQSRDLPGHVISLVT